MLRREDDKRFVGPPIIELEFEKDILDPHTTRQGENIQLRMKKERPILYERCLQFRHPKKYCRSNRELCKEPHKTGKKKIKGIK